MSELQENFSFSTKSMNLSKTERVLRIFSDIRTGEGVTGLLLMLNIFLVLASYYCIKPVREGWLSISAVQGLSKLEIKAYSSFAQSMVLLLIIPLYGRLVNRVSRRTLLTLVTLFCIVNLVFFRVLQHGLLGFSIPYIGFIFYLWVGIFGVLVVAQFWSFAADLYTDEMGKRLFPLIAIGASAGAVFGSWLTGQFIKREVKEIFDLILVAIIPLSLALVLTWIADHRGAKESIANRVPDKKPSPDPHGTRGTYRLIFKNRYLFAMAGLMLLMNWVSTNGENILYGTVQMALESEYTQDGITNPAEINRYIKTGTTSFYGDMYFWVNLCSLIIQAFLVSRLLKYGGLRTILFLMPLISFLSYSIMSVFSVLLIIRIMKIAENSTNYSVNNTARHVLWLPLPSQVIYKAKTAIDTLFVRMGDGLAALTVFLGTQLFLLPIRNFMLLNLLLVILWGIVAFFVIRENERILQSLQQ